MKTCFRISQSLTYLFITLSVFFLFPLTGCSTPQVNVDQSSNLTAAGPPGKHSPAQQIGPDEYRIGNMTLNKRKGELSIPGQVNMQSGLVEYLACWESVGKLHESVLKVEAKPSDVHIALLLLGLTQENNLKFQGDPAVPKGDLLEIWVEWKLPDKTSKRVRAEDLVYHQVEKKPMARTSWAFTGSQIVDGQFIADLEGSIIAIFRDPVAIINNPLPAGADDTVYVSHEKLLPPAGTNVSLIIKAARRVPSGKVTL